MDGQVGHSPAETAWAEAAFLAGKPYDLGMAAAPADQVQAALFDDAAREVLLELAHHELRQASRC
jgi:hypothetical protein